MAVTNAVSWRMDGIRNQYRKNEEFMDVNTNGNIVRSEILGAVKMECYLSGTPLFAGSLKKDKIGRARGGGLQPRRARLRLTPALMNNHKEDESGPLLGIIRTNGYGFDNLWDSDGPTIATPRDAYLYTGIGKVGSRINHSCMPNIWQKFKLDCFSLQFTASRDIKAGEQMFYSYCGVYPGVICECSACVNATPETDKLRKEIDKRFEIYDLITRKDLDEMFRFQEGAVKEGLHSQTPSSWR
ncbi:hypothetical protein BDZ97DRAFT_2060107 [Flammula alnicola]|nr:hypothetical protein BDZ97DRAFT_2060107 [Flammula alnicola]